MKFLFYVTLIVSIILAYNIYIPLPETVAEPWKLMFLDAALRLTFSVGSLFQSLGVCHQAQAMRCIIRTLQDLSPEPKGGLKVTDTIFAGVEVRIYESNPERSNQLQPGLVFIHGGGWALGSNKERSYDLLCRKMAEELKAVIVSVEYVLVPEARFPKQFDDCLEATKHFLKPEVLSFYSVDPGRVGVSGDSAGGNLAAAVAQKIGVDDSILVKLRVQALIYPVLQALDFHTPSYQQNQHMPILYPASMVKFWLEYLGADPSLLHSMLMNNHTAKNQKALSKHRPKFDWRTLLSPEFQKHYKPVIHLKGSPKILKNIPALLDTRAMPLLAEEQILQKTPRAYVLICEHDVLRDDGLMYARRLEQAGVLVTIDHIADGFHGILSVAFGPIHFSVGERAFQNFISWLSKYL